MKPVIMEHPKALATIAVQPAQVPNAKYHGWVEVKPAKVVSDKPKRGKEDGKS